MRSRLILFILLVSATASWAAEPMRVAFINPDPKGSAFWDQVTSFMQAVADDLDIRLTVYHGDRGRFELRDNCRRALEAKERPDYIVTLFQRNVAVPLVKQVQASEAKLFVINTGIPQADRFALGAPREKFSSWIGHIFPDDEGGGYDLIRFMADNAPTLAGAGPPPYRMAGITGGRESTPGMLRKKGCISALETIPNVRLGQVVHAYWDRQKAISAIHGLLKRYPDISLIWSAGGVMTDGILETLSRNRIIPGKDVLIGTFDWSSDVIKRIKSGEILASAGGHFLEGGWALILLYDYHRGLDFKDCTGVSIRSPMAVLTKANLADYEAVINGRSWDRIDFKRLTRTCRGQDTSYHLNMATLASALKKGVKAP